LGYELFASRGSALFLENNGVPCTPLYWPLERKSPNIADYIRERKLDLIINIPKNNQETELRNNYLIRRMAIDFDIPLFTNIRVARQFIDALAQVRKTPLEIEPWEHYGVTREEK
jgi:carbamoyl-phosphate synthase large subunit